MRIWRKDDLSAPQHLHGQVEAQCSQGLMRGWAGWAGGKSRHTPRVSILFRGVSFASQVHRSRFIPEHTQPWWLCVPYSINAVYFLGLHLETEQRPMGLIMWKFIASEAWEWPWAHHGGDRSGRNRAPGFKPHWPIYLFKQSSSKLRSGTWRMNRIACG